MPQLPEIIASFEGKGYVIAPAGFGKTHLIAAATKCNMTRQLILTHTHAGVDAIKRKLQKLEVASKFYEVETIASFILKLCLSYPVNSGWTKSDPQGVEWEAINGHCLSLFEKKFIKKIIRASYGGLYVDEYQDCSLAQHQVILGLSELIPTRIFGDPFQAIFEDFHVGIDWTEIESKFELLGKLEIPHRWIHSGDSELGQWLVKIRGDLEQGREIHLTNEVPQVVSVHIVSSDDELRNKQITECKYSNKAGTTIAIHKGDGAYKAKCHNLAKLTGGIFSSFEEMEGKRVFEFIDKYERTSTAKKKLLFIIQFLKEKCFNSLSDCLSAATKRGEKCTIRAYTKNKIIAEAANLFLEGPTPQNLGSLLLAIKGASETKIFNRDLFNRLLNIIKNWIATDSLTFRDAGLKFHAQLRFTGRPLSYPKLIGTTLLVKGQEYDHAIVLEASSLSKKDLYVALTRGSKSLTIISKSGILRPT